MTKILNLTPKKFQSTTNAILENIIKLIGGTHFLAKKCMYILWGNEG